MQIQDRFRVDLPVDAAWRVLVDIERIAPCLPGAQLQEVEGDEYRGVVKVKVGPITAQYKGSARFTELDDAAHRAVIAASGRDTRGQGNASATITAALEADGEATVVRIDTDLSITGKVAQFGRGVLADVSSKLLAQFVENLERDVLGARPGDEVDVATRALDVVALEAEERDTSSMTEVPGPGLVAPPRRDGVRSIATRRVDAPEAEPVDLLAVSGTPVLKRLAPVLAAIVALLLLRGLWRRRRARCERRTA